ncbi:hypothetical protein V6N12_028422 [Hibiscus sabdariffa]|uniref:Uncharacterized protein n=1 Tax=Hibiscus sabdariffa TaxID=183260 RepID=A0ABR2F5U7_9ROSI
MFSPIGSNPMIPISPVPLQLFKENNDGHRKNRIEDDEEIRIWGPSIRAAVRAWGNQWLQEADPELSEIMNKDKKKAMLRN